MEPIDLSAVLSAIRAAPSFERLSAALREGRLTLGVGDAAKPVTLAAIAGEWTGTVLIITPRMDRAEALAEEVSAWLGDPDRVLVYPERDALPYERLAPAPDTVRDRLRTAGGLGAGERRVIIASGLAVAQRTLAADEAQDAVRRLSAGEPLEIDGFLRELGRLGYSIEPLVTEAGQAGRRGGIIDVFPPAAELPVRIELLGREIESLRTFDPATQRSVSVVDAAKIGPAREIVSPELSRLRSLDFSRCGTAVRERFEEEMSQLAEGLGFPERDFYVPLLARSTLLDHAP